MTVQNVISHCVRETGVSWDKSLVTIQSVSINVKMENLQDIVEINVYITRYTFRVTILLS